LEAEIDQWTDGIEQRVENLLTPAESGAKGNGGFQSSVSYPDHARYQKGACTIPDLVRRLEINWISGTVRMEHWDGEGISLEETAGDDADHQLRWRVENDSLMIQYCAPGRYQNLPTKDLVVRLPKNTPMAVYVHTVSADCTTIGLELRELEFDSSSGTLNADGVYSDLSAETVSGNLTATGQIGELEVDTTSGNTELTLQCTPDEISYESVSGDLKLTLPGERSFSLEQETVSGETDCELPLQRNGSHWYYDSGSAIPAAELELSTVSGRMQILQTE